MEKVVQTETEDFDRSVLRGVLLFTGKQGGYRCEITVEQGDHLLYKAEETLATKDGAMVPATFEMLLERARDIALAADAD